MFGASRRGPEAAAGSTVRPAAAVVRARLLAREDGVVAAAALVVRALLARDRHYNSHD